MTDIVVVPRWAKEIFKKTEDISISVPMPAVCCLFCQGVSHACL